MSLGDETEDSTEDLFDDSGDETDIINYNDTDSLSKESDDDTDDEALLFDHEEEHCREYYLVEQQISI